MVGVGEVVEGGNWENMCHIRQCHHYSLPFPFCPCSKAIAKFTAYLSTSCPSHFSLLVRASSRRQTADCGRFVGSGQWWAACSAEERSAYESTLEPILMDGMRYLWNHPSETGTLGLRFLRNTSSSTPHSDDNETLALETSGAGFHANWADLELWASRHPSHLRIFTANAEHSERFGKEKKFMTWHEVSILKEGEAGWGYVNCTPGTGMSGKGVGVRRRGLER